MTNAWAKNPGPSPHKVPKSLRDAAPLFPRQAAGGLWGEEGAILDGPTGPSDPKDGGTPVTLARRMIQHRGHRGHRVWVAIHDSGNALDQPHDIEVDQEPHQAI